MFTKVLSVTEMSMKLFLETVTYIAIKERVTPIITIETVTCLMHYRKYHLHNCGRDSNLHNYAAETVTCICAAETSNCIIATETVTCITATERSTNITVTESTASKPAKMQQKLSPA